jgi:hypothetical protein
MQRPTDVFEFPDDPNDDTSDDVEEHGAETGTDGKKGKTPRVRLTLEEKIMLVRHSWGNPGLTRKELMVWSQKQFAKQKSVSIQTISNILCDSHVLKAAAGTGTSQLTLSMKTNRKPKFTEKGSRDSAQKEAVAKANTWLVSATLQVGWNICDVLADRKKWQDALPAIYIAYACSEHESEVSELLHQVEILVHAQPRQRISQHKMKEWLDSDGIKEMECTAILPGKRNHFTTHKRIIKFLDQTALRNDAAPAPAGKRTRVICHGNEDAEKADKGGRPSLSRTTKASGATAAASATGGAGAAAPVSSQPLPPSTSFPPASSPAPTSAQQPDFSNDTRQVNRNGSPRTSPHARLLPRTPPPPHASPRTLLPHLLPPNAALPPCAAFQLCRAQAPLNRFLPPPRAHAPGGDRGHGPSPPYGGLKARAADDKHCCRPLRAQNVMGPLTAEAD